MFSLSLSHFYQTPLFAIQMGDWNVSRLQDFSALFLVRSDITFRGADLFNEPLNWDTGTCQQMLPPFKPKY